MRPGNGNITRFKIMNLSVPNLLIKTNTKKVWPYDEYYIGEKDNDERRSGHGKNHWSEAESVEWYTGQFLRDTMHGLGDYCWRCLGSSITYEGHFYANHMHGYGTMSYPDGRVFTGLYDGDWRWGPGVTSHPEGLEDVGLWRGSQLVRLAWSPHPPGMSLIPDFFAVPRGREFVEPYRLVLASSVKTIENTCHYLQFGVANTKLEIAEPPHTKQHVCCTEPYSDTRLCYAELFENAYYGKQTQSLKEIDTVSQGNTTCSTAETVMTEDNTAYYAWNKNSVPLQMMKHCFKHEHQRSSFGLDLMKVMSGPREDFKPPGEHERSCRSLLMASYLGQIDDIDRLLNEQNLYIDVADKLGNTALMYAVCGNQHDTIRYLLVAGAAVNNYNDAGLTPLGVALMMYVATQRDYTTFNVISGVLPPENQHLVHSQHESMVFEWNMSREFPPQPASKNDQPKSLDRMSKNYRSRSIIEKPKSQLTLKSVVSTRPSNLQQKTDTTSTLKLNKDKSRSMLKITRSAPIIESTEIIVLCTEEEQIYKNISLEYLKRANELFLAEVYPPQMSYLFDFQNMEGQQHHRKMSVKHLSGKSSSKFKMSKHEYVYDESYEKNKMGKLIEIHLTIEKLLSDGADPRLVRCPQPALVMAMAAKSADLVRSLIQKGADVNERYPQFSGFTALDIAISRPLSPDTTELVRALLENKASVDHRLPREDKHDNESGPTLLHVITSKEPENEPQRKTRTDISGLLLDRGCDACALFNGSSVIDTVVTTKNLTLLDIFIKSLHGCLNRPINSLNQSLLVKIFGVPCFRMFTPEERVEVLTSLLVHGADPLLECQNESETYPNIFVYALKSIQGILVDKEYMKKRKTSIGTKSHSPPHTGRKSTSPRSTNKTKQRKAEERDEKKLSPSSTKNLSEAEYREALTLVSDWARMMHIKWIQITLMKELVQLVNKYKHRSWHLIIRDHKSRNNVCLWLSVTKCLELWDILKTTTTHAVYKDNKVLKFLLCIVQYYKMRQNEEKKLTSQEKELLESDVTKLMHEHNIVEVQLTELNVTKYRAFHKLDVENENKFNVCFECSQPLSKSALLCDLCGLVSFCNVTCLIENCTRGAQCHPCSDHLTGVCCPHFEDTSIIYSGVSGPKPFAFLQHGDSGMEKNQGLA